MPQENTSRRAGFTLVELAIILVIIGLIIGGVLAGQTLIRGAEVRSVGAQFEKHKAAIYTFRNRFNGFPGDMKNATDMWGAAADCQTWTGAVSDGKATCNGNGDKVLNPPTNPSGNQTPFEGLLLWQHLSIAELTSGTYSAYHPPTNESETRQTYPHNDAFDGYWMADSLTGSLDKVFGGKSFGTYMWFFKADFSPFITPEEAWKIDSKYDDGLPGQGKIQTWTGANGTYPRPNCTEKPVTKAVTTDADKDALYKVTYAEQACDLLFVDVF